MRVTRPLIWVAGLLALLVVAGVALAANVDRYRGQLQAVLAERLNRTIGTGRLHLSLWPLGLRVEGVSIGEDTRFQTGRPFARAEDLYVSPRLLPLLQGRFEVRSIELRRPAIELVRSAQSVWNWSSLGGSESSGESSLVLGRLIISGGEIAITDYLPPPGARGRAAAPVRAVYRNIDVDLRDYAPRQPFTLAVSATLPGATNERLGVRGTAGPVVAGEPARTPFAGSVELDAVSLSGLQRFLERDVLDGTDAVVSGTTEVTSRDGQVIAKGTLALENARIRGVALGYPVTAAFDVAHDVGASRSTVTSATLRLDETPVALSGTVDSSGEAPVLDVRATTSDASLAEAARLASAFGVAFGRDMTVAGRLTADVRARGPAETPALEGAVRLRDVRIAGAGVPSAVTTPALDVALSPAEIRTNEFTATTNATSVAVQAAVGRYTTASPTIDARVRVSDASLADVLAIATAWGAGAEGVTGTGRLTVDVRASGTTRSPQYSGGGRLTDATILTPSITQPLRVRTAALTFGADAMTLEGLAFSLSRTSGEGRLSVRNFDAPRVEFELGLDAVDVADLQAVVAPASEEAAAPETAGGAAPESALLRTTGGGRVRIGSIAHGPLRLEDVQGTAVLDRGVVRLDPLTATLFGGMHRGAITVDARQTPPAITLTSDVVQVDANRLASAATNVRDIIYGALSSQIRASATAGGAGSFVQSLNGTLALDLPQGRIAKMDLMREIGAIGRFLTGREAAERATPVTALTGRFTVTNGVAETSDLQASIEGGTIGAAGVINLVDEAVNLRVTAVLSREWSQRVGGNRIGGFMTTALANPQGELVVPMLVTGTLSQPRFAPDAQSMAEMKLKNLVPSLRQPGLLGGSLLDAITGRGREAPPSAGGDGDAQPGAPAPDAAGQTPTPPAEETAKPAEPRRPADRLQDALRGVLGGRRREEPPPKEDPPN